MAEDEADGFTAREVRETTGLSYRQLNDWESRGAFEAEAERGSKWRRFTPKQIFALTVCAELRKQFGFSVKQLRFVNDFMNQEGANHLEVAIQMMASLGLPVWLCTDGKEAFIMDSELEFRDLVEHGFLGGGHKEAAYAFLKVSPLVNRLLASVKDPVQIEAHGHAYEIIEWRRKFGARSQEEFEVLQLIRSGDFDSVEIVLTNGQVKTIHAKKHHKNLSIEDIESLVVAHEYQTISVTQKAGRVVTVTQDITKKPGNAAS